MNARIGSGLAEAQQPISINPDSEPSAPPPAKNQVKLVTATEATARIALYHAKHPTHQPRRAQP